MGAGHFRTVNAAGCQERTDPAAFAIDWCFNQFSLVALPANVIFIRQPGNQLAVRIGIIEADDNPRAGRI